MIKTMNIPYSNAKDKDGKLITPLPYINEFSNRKARRDYLHTPGGSKSKLYVLHTGKYRIRLQKIYKVIEKVIKLTHNSNREQVFNIKDNSELIIYRGNLISGKYYIRLVGKEVYSAVLIFE